MRADPLQFEEDFEMDAKERFSRIDQEKEYRHVPSSKQWRRRADEAVGPGGASGANDVN